jgi:hypothetical protein
MSKNGKTCNFLTIFVDKVLRLNFLQFFNCCEISVKSCVFDILTEVFQKYFLDLTVLAVLLHNVDAHNVNLIGRVCYIT